MGELVFQIVSVLIIIFPLAVFILSLINDSTNTVSSILNEIGESLNDYPIEDFSYSNDCGEKYAGDIYVFPGSVHGCSCVNVNSYYYPQTGKYLLNVGECDMNQTFNDCFDIPQVPQQKVYSFGEGKFCYKKYNTEEFELKGYLHYLNNSVLENEECEIDYKKCGKLDDMGNYICIKKDENCPINDIQVRISKDEELEKLNYAHIIANDKYYYFTNTSEKPVINKLKVAEEGKICIDRTYFHTNYPQWILDNNFEYYGCRNKINGEIFEKDIQALDYRTKKQIYNDSGIDLDYIYKHSGYDYPFYSLEANMTLYPQRYIGYDKKCLSNSGVFDIDNSPFNGKKIKAINNIVDELFSNNTIIKWVSLPSLVILLVLGVLIVMKKYNIWLWIWVIIYCLFYVNIAIRIYSNISKCKKITEFPICGGDLINAKINLYHSAQRKFKITTILSIIIINLQLLYIIFMIVLKFNIDIKLNNEVADIKDIDKTPIPDSINTLDPLDTPDNRYTPNNPYTPDCPS